MPAPLPEPLEAWTQGEVDGLLSLHASAVAVHDRAVLILGPSGAGKSTLALELLAFGARLIADDLVLLSASGSEMIAAPATEAAPLIEARGIGVLNAGVSAKVTPVGLAVDLARAEPDRLPPLRRVHLRDAHIPVIFGAGQPSLAAAVIVMMRHGRAVPEP